MPDMGELTGISSSPLHFRWGVHPIAPQSVSAYYPAMKDDKIPPTGERASASLEGRTNLPHRILVVDDDASIRQWSAVALVRSGYHVDAAEDGAAGWEALQAKHYDLVITDNMMPKVTGVEMVNMLRGQGATLPVILASGAIPTEELKRHPWLEINAILPKPYTVAELLGAVKEILRAIGGAHEQIPMPMNGPSQPPAAGLQLG
jgi:CheY-like chemotaxis protein